MGKMNITIDFCILQLAYVPNFSLTVNFGFPEQICPKSVFPV